MSIKVLPTDFIQKVMRLDGQPWRFTHRPYIYPIINNNNKRILMLAARQVEKSTTMAGCMLAQGCLNPNRSYLYVSPTMKQTGVYSRKKIDEVFETSPMLKKAFYPGVKGFRVEEKRLKNHTTLYFRSAFHDADGIRGITSAGTQFDELQDILQDVIPIVEACSQKQLDAQFRYAGTPKTFDNTIHLQWELSSQNEWHVKCKSCGNWNLLDIGCVILDKPGIWCKKCQNKIWAIEGVWVRGKESDVDGYRLPYIILHQDYIDWKDLFFKCRNHDTGTLMNETFGVSYDNGVKPLTREQLIAACDPQWKLWSEVPTDYLGQKFYAGIDWGGGNTGFTVLTIGFFDPSVQKFRVVFAKRFIGKEAEPENVVHAIAAILIRFDARIIGADWGFGIGFNGPLKKLLPSNFHYVTYRHSIIKKFLAWDELGQTYVTNRTEVMTHLFSKIKSEKFALYRWSEFEDIGKDYLNITSEFSERLRQVKYIHTQPDDSFHSALMMYLNWMIMNKEVPATRLDPGDEDDE